MEIIDNIDEILEKLNKIRNEKKIGIEKIANDISKDKSVTSRILSGKYNLDLLTFLNICTSLDIDPTSVIEQVIYPNSSRITISDENIKSLEEIVKSINEIKKN